METSKEKTVAALGVSTRSKTSNIAINQRPVTRNNKRKAEENSETDVKTKRSALGNLTNLNKQQPKKDISQQEPKKNVTHFQASKTNNENIPTVPSVAHKIVTRGTAAVVKAQIVTLQENKSSGNAIKGKLKDTKASSKATKRLSNEFEKSESSLYVSAVEDLTSESVTSDESKTVENDLVVSIVPEGVEDFDKENLDDPNQVSEYAMEIFAYMKEREKLFPVADYMLKQLHLSKWMRSLLIDWMVEVQESFELNHETLYLATKLVDIYLSRKTIDRDNLQLLGATALLISSKFDERTPPLVEDFLYICDGAYNKKTLLQMERDVLQTIGYDLGIPISYRFLRRYARCAKVSMSVLTLARFILEYSLMDYQTITLSDSKLACAALYMALKMNKLTGWNKTLEYYSGYAVDEFKSIVTLLNEGLHKKPKEGLNTIRTKYSHIVFHEVAKIPLISTLQLFENDTTL